MEKIELTMEEAQKLLNYLASKPLSESYNLFNMIASKINEEVKIEE